MVTDKDALSKDGAGKGIGCFGDGAINLVALCGIDAVPILSYGDCPPTHITPVSLSFIQYGPKCPSQWLRHLL